MDTDWQKHPAAAAIYQDTVPGRLREVDQRYYSFILGVSKVGRDTLLTNDVTRILDQTTNL